MALSGKKKGTVTANSSKFTYYLEWSATQDITANSSTITVKHYWRNSSTGGFDSVGTRRYGITIGDKDFEGTKRMDYDPWTDKNISTATHTVTHGDDGKLSLTISTYANGKASSYGPSSETGTAGDCKASVTITLDDIPRAATLDSAPNFNDEQNPTITYSNPAGEAVDSVQVGIFDINGATAYASYRNVSETGSSYTFTLTDAERNKLIAAIPDGQNWVYVRFYLKTIINGEAVTPIRYLQRKLTITNATPTIATTVIDTGSASTALTNDSSVVIKGYNYMYAEMTPTLKKGATVKAQSITNGATVRNAASGEFGYTDSNVFIFSLIDSFGQTVTETVTTKFVDYVELTCNLVTSNPTADGNIAIKVSGNYFNGKFGDNGVNNTLGVQLRYKVNDGAYGDWETLTPTKDGNTYSVIVNKTGLNYQSVYTFQARAYDKRYPDTNPILSTEKRVKTQPVYDWGESDFNFNVPVSFSNGITYFKGLIDIIYPVGAIYLSVNSTNPGTLFPGTTWTQLKDRFLLGAGDTYANAATGGAATVTLTTKQIPAHTHTAQATNFYIRHGAGANTDMVAQGNNTTIDEGVASTTWNNGVSTESYSHKLDKVNINTTLNNTGGGEAHNNMPPYLVVYMWKRTA